PLLRAARGGLVGPPVGKVQRGLLEGEPVGAQQRAPRGVQAVRGRGEERLRGRRVAAPRRKRALHGRQPALGVLEQRVVTQLVHLPATGARRVGSVRLLGE